MEESDGDLGNSQPKSSRSEGPVPSKAAGKVARGGIVTARGTGDGLVIRLDGRVDEDSLRTALVEFVSSRENFLSGNEVVFEWVGAEPSATIVQALTQELSKSFGVRVRSSSMRARSVTLSDSQSADIGQHGGKAVSLFDGIEGFSSELNPTSEGIGNVTVESVREEGSSSPVLDAALWDDPDCRIVYATLRSGQKIETEHSLVIVGDVNSGAEIVAGGDIVVLGTLRGVAHAGAYDETGGGRFIFALDLRPTQLRIGVVISRGASDSQRLPEIARVDGSLIIVEPYQARHVQQRFRGG